MQFQDTLYMSGNKCSVFTRQCNTLILLYAIIPFNVSKIRPLFLLAEKLWFRPLPTQQTQEMNIHALSNIQICNSQPSSFRPTPHSIQICNSNNQAASDLHLRLHSHWDQLTLATRSDLEIITWITKCCNFKSQA